jgi:hypothetical protein
MESWWLVIQMWWWQEGRSNDEFKKSTMELRK